MGSQQPNTVTAAFDSPHAQKDGESFTAEGATQTEAWRTAAAIALLREE
jgi:hypothetical protein